MEPTEGDTLMTPQTLNITEHCTFSVTVSKAHQSPQGAADGVLVPGGFGHGSEESKAKFLLPCAMYARENKCSIPRHRPGRLGMQVAIIELARSVPGLKDANSADCGV